MTLIESLIAVIELAGADVGQIQANLTLQQAAVSQLQSAILLNSTTSQGRSPVLANNQINFYQKIALRVTDILRRRGQILTLDHTSGSAFDPITGIETHSVDQLNIYGAMDKNSQSVSQSGLGVTSKSRAFIEPSYSAEVGDSLTENGRVWAVSGVEMYQPSGIRLLSILELER